MSDTWILEVFHYSNPHGVRICVGREELGRFNNHKEANEAWRAAAWNDVDDANVWHRLIKTNNKA